MIANTNKSGTCQAGGLARQVAAALLLVFAAVLLAACNQTQGNIQQKVDRNILKATLGKDYAAIAAQRNTTLEGLFQDDRAYGELFATTLLDNGDTLYRHMDRYEAGESSVSGVLRTRENIRYAYRLLYFRVGPDGRIRDTANGYLGGETASCVGWSGGIFRRCESEDQQQLAVRQYDSMVRTESGASVLEWLPVEGAVAEEGTVEG